MLLTEWPQRGGQQQGFSPWLPKKLVYDHYKHPDFRCAVGMTTNKVETKEYSDVRFA
jgi:hypothetical protein